MPPLDSEPRRVWPRGRRTPFLGGSRCLCGHCRRVSTAPFWTRRGNRGSAGPVPLYCLFSGSEDSTGSQPGPSFWPLVLRASAGAFSVLWPVEVGETRLPAERQRPGAGSDRPQAGRLCLLLSPHVPTARPLPGVPTAVCMWPSPWSKRTPRLGPLPVSGPGFPAISVQLRAHRLLLTLTCPPPRRAGRCPSSRSCTFHTWRRTE